MGTWLKQRRWDLRNELAKHRFPYLALARLRPRTAGGGAAPVSRRTQVVIEGFPRCANSFATHAFALAQHRPVRLAHHLHAPAQIKAGAHRHLPILILIREPEAAILSVRAYAPWIRNRQLLRAYIDFYKTVSENRDLVLIAPFDEVTSDFGCVIDRLNNKFGTRFERFEHTRENVDRCFRLIAQNGSELFVSRPSAQRERHKAGLRAGYWNGNLSAMRARADELYKSLYSSMLQG